MMSGHLGVLAAAFLTSTVEWVEAYTIVLAVALSIGWRRALLYPERAAETDLNPGDTTA